MGDPDFPNIIMNASRGEKIVRFQSLYKQYSHLSFSQPEDRAVAINGLESRLLKAFQTKGGFGIFDEGDGPDSNMDSTARMSLLRRSLLWRRAPSTAKLERIQFPPDRFYVPSWSWMAFTGAIDYLDLDFNGVQWSEILSPWSPQRSKTETHHMEGRGRAPSLTAVARDFYINPEGSIIMDVPGGLEKPSLLKAVVLGIQRELDRRHFILVVTKIRSHSRAGADVYERVGVGWVGEQCISSKEALVEIY